MSQLTNFAENALVDFTRGVAPTLPTNWSIRLASAASETGFTELSGTGYAPEDVPRSLSAWLSTQGNSLASTGTSHATSNQAAIDFGVAGGAWGTWSHIVMCDAGGNPWTFLQLPTPIVINNGDPVSIAAGDLAFTLGLTGGCSDYLANKLIDLIFRGQAFTYPASSNHDLLTAAPTNAGGGTVPSGGSYAAVALSNTTANWSGTQAPGSTTSSSGTGGESSNNVPIVWPAPTASWGTVGWHRERDGSNNLLFWAPLDAAVTVSAGASAPRVPAGRAIRAFA